VENVVVIVCGGRVTDWTGSAWKDNCGVGGGRIGESCLNDFCWKCYLGANWLLTIFGDKVLTVGVWFPTGAVVLTTDVVVWTGTLLDA